MVHFVWWEVCMHSAVDRLKIVRYFAESLSMWMTANRQLPDIILKCTCKHIVTLLLHCIVAYTFCVNYYFLHPCYCTMFAENFGLVHLMAIHLSCAHCIASSLPWIHHLHASTMPVFTAKLCCCHGYVSIPLSMYHEIFITALITQLLEGLLQFQWFL